MNSDYSHPLPFLVLLLSLLTLPPNHKFLSHISIFLFLLFESYYHYYCH